MPKRTEKIAITVEAPTTKKRKGVVPKSAFKEGNQYAFKKGQSGNPSGRPSAATDRLLSKAFRVQLGARAKDEVTSALDLPRGSSWATCLAASAIRRAIRGSVADLQAILSATEPASSRGAGFDPMGLGGELLGPIPELTINLVPAIRTGPELPSTRQAPTLDAAIE